MLSETDFSGVNDRANDSGTIYISLRAAYRSAYNRFPIYEVD